MDIFIKLRELINSSVKELEKEIDKINNDIDRNEEIKRIIKVLDNDEVYLSQIKMIGQYFPEYLNYIMLLNEIQSMLLSIENRHFKEVLPDRIRVVLSSADMPSADVIKTINDFILCDKLDNYIKGEEVDSRIKEIVLESYRNVSNKLDTAFQNILGVLANEIKRNFVPAQSNIFQNQKNHLINEIEVLKRIELLFNDNGLISDFNQDDLKFFYNWLSDKLSFDERKEIIKNIIYFQSKKQIKTEEDIIDENRKKIIEKIKSIILTKEKNCFDSIDFKSLNEEDLNIVLEIKRIYLEMNKLYSERIVFTDAELGDRKDSYYHDKIEWEIVLADIENNLVPNIIAKHDFVINVFKYIIDIYKKYENQKKSMESLKGKIQTIDLLLVKLKKLLNCDELYNTSYDDLFDNNIDSSDLRYDGKYEYYAIRYFIRKSIVPFIEDLENKLNIISSELAKNKINDDISIDEINDKYDLLTRQYYDKLDSYLKTHDTENNYDKSANLMFCYGNLELPTEEHQSELIETLKDFKEKSPYKLNTAGTSRREQFAPIKRPTGVKDEYITFDNPRIKPYCKFFLPYRYAGMANYRTGLIHFNHVHPIIKKKLVERYDFNANGGIYAVFKVIQTVKADHDQYADFVKYIYRHMDELEELGKKFANPNTDIEELYQVIDNGIEIKNELIKDGTQK